MKSNNTIDQATLDRLVDGELDAELRRDLIASLGQIDDGWMQCALAFLESQSFGQEIGAIYGEDLTPSSEISRTDAIADRQPTANHPPKFGWWLATAACVLFAFTLGTRLQSPSPARGPAAEIPETPANDDGQHQLVETRRPNLWQGESMVPPDVEGAMQRLGLRINRQKGFVPAVSPDGDQLLIPYEDVRIMPAGHHPQ